MTETNFLTGSEMSHVTQKHLYKVIARPFFFWYDTDFTPVLEIVNPSKVAPTSKVAPVYGRHFLWHMTRVYCSSMPDPHFSNNVTNVRWTRRVSIGHPVRKKDQRLSTVSKYKIHTYFGDIW